MLALLTSKWRKRAAAILVAFYALCLVAPVTAFAFSDGSMPAHCLTDDHHDMGVAHDHQDGADHDKSGPGDDYHGQAGKCCGLFCLSAVAPSVFDVVGARLLLATDVVMPAAESLFGRSSSRIDRPPRSLLSL
jgi:hypothetical protein